ncbi:MAG: TonB-dependent receptor [Bacteroidales bacterium]|nr:TonB-dependent receptor [Bacteroidales bacterium]MBN2818829.1 TonB-dependent receptor [Bacteroidales bacterium]
MKIYRLTNIIHSIIFLLFFANSQFLDAQISGPTISVDLKDATFRKFVEEVYTQTNVTISFKEEWVEHIKVNITGSNLGLNSALTQVLEDSGIKFFQDQSNNIVLFTGKEIVEQLPDYSIYKTGKISNSDTSSDGSKLTDTEKKYQEGKKVTQLELVTVGNSTTSTGDKRHIIRGRITEEETGNPILGATVFIKELGMGAATDNDGYFNLAVKQGKYLVVANSLSMAEKKFYLEVNSSGSISIPLKKELHNIMEVKVVADRHDNVTGMQMGYTRVTTKNIKEIPAVLGEKDLIKVAQLLPGVQSAGEGASGLNVRGGTADQNLFYINKVPVYNTSHLFGFFTSFSSDIINDFSLYKSNIPAKYGGRVSSVFDITTRKGNKKEFFGKGGISPVTSHIAVEGPIVKENTSFVLSYRGTYSDWILSRLDDVNLRNSNASFYDLSGSVNSEINDNNLVKFFAYNSYDQFSLSTTDDYNYSNTGSSIAWKHIFSPRLNGDFALVYSKYDFGHNNKSNLTEAYRQVYQLEHTELKSDFIYLNAQNHRISFGESAIFYNLNRGTISPFGEESTRIPIDLGIEKGIEGAVYVSDEFSISPRLTALAGIRYSMYTLTGPAKINKYFPNSPIDKNNIEDTLSFNANEIVKMYSGPEPRIALNYSIGTNQSVKASYNRIRQYIFMLSNTIAISPTDQWKLSDYYIKPPVTDQVSLGYYHDVPDWGIVTSTEVYGKWTKNVVEYKDGVDFISDIPTEMLLLQGNQKAYGFEFLFKKNTGKFTGWLSYCYSRSLVDVSSDIPTEQINYGKAYPSNFDRPHSVNFVSTLRSNRRLSLSTNFVYSTGRPITYPVAIYYAENQEILHFSERNKYRIPDYFRVDVSINLEGNLNRRKWIHSYWMLNVYNLTGRKNAYSVYFEAVNGLTEAYKLSVFGQPIITLSWNFKFGNYASE